MVSDSSQVVFNLDTFVVDGTVHILAQNLHSYASLTVDALVPEILIFRLKAFEL